MSADQPKKGRRKQKVQDEVKVDTHQPLPRANKQNKANKIVDPIVDVKAVEKKPRRPRQPKEVTKVQVKPMPEPQSKTLAIDEPMTSLATAIAQVAEVKVDKVEPKAKVDSVDDKFADFHNSCNKPSISYNDLVQIKLDDPVALVKPTSLWDRVVAWFKRQVG